MKTLRLTKKQLTELKKNGKLWGRKYYYEIVEPKIVKYHKISYTTEKGIKLHISNTSAEYYNLWMWGKIREDV